ncbi:MAG: hypothetical protein MUD12_07170 [Spirochaetes bacterium]|jgi:hypothetical protein|nr:hypothetical protein [Spirochaetota bacterium]
MLKKEILNSYLKSNNVPENILKKINCNSVLTDNFAYGVLRIGNSIGDLLDISIELILLEEIAKKFNLVLDTTEHAEFHTRGNEEKDLDHLVKAAKLFDAIKEDKKSYHGMIHRVKENISSEADKLINK